MDPKARTAAATAARVAKYEARLARILRERGWTCEPPADNPAHRPAEPDVGGPPSAAGTEVQR